MGSDLASDTDPPPELRSLDSHIPSFLVQRCDTRSVAEVSRSGFEGEE